MSLTYQELSAQYDALQKTYTLMTSDAENLRSFFAEGNFSKVVFIGCGSSYTLALSMARTFQMHLNQNALAIAGGDLMLHAERYAQTLQGSLIVPISRSGSTSEVVYSIEKLKALGVTFSLLSFVCVADSALGKISDKAYELPWAYDSSICQTRTVTNLYYCGALMSAILSADNTQIEELKELAENGYTYFKRVEPALKAIAEKPWTHAVTLADAEIAGIAEEGALTFKEICQLNSNFYHLLDSRHGPMVMFKPDTLVILAMSDVDCKFERDFIKDLKAKNSEIIVYSDAPCNIDGITNICYGQQLSHISRGIPFILISQVITYYKSAITGANPDSPEGLSAWIKL